MTHEPTKGRAMKRNFIRAGTATVARSPSRVDPVRLRGRASAAAKNKAYPSPEAAVEDFIGAIRNYNLDALLAIFGEDSNGSSCRRIRSPTRTCARSSCGCTTKKHAITPHDETTTVLLVGTDSWPLPIPLVKSSAGWTFDTEEGIEEIINRRVGRNELSAIQTCLAIGDAQREYFRRDRDGDGILEYAPDVPQLPRASGRPVLARRRRGAAEPDRRVRGHRRGEGYGQANTAYHGYRYRMLTSQGPPRRAAPTTTSCGKIRSAGSPSSPTRRSTATPES